MKISRKEFLRAGALVTGGFLLHGHNYFLKTDEQPAGFKVLRGNVGVFIERGGTMGWYVSDDAVIVIDSQFPESAEHFYGGLKSKTSRKIDFLINTHHHRDHTSGNVYLREFTSKIVSSENCRMLQEKMNGGDPARPQAYADITFADEWNLSIGKESVKAFHLGPAHTGGDAVIHFQNANIAHMGDLVFNKVYPVIDIAGGAKLYGWIDYLEKVEKMFDKETFFIFGHAQTPEMVTGYGKDLLVMRDYISALLDFVNKEMKSGKTKEEIAAATSIPNVVDVKEMWQGAMKRNLENAFDELSASNTNK